MIRFLMGRPGSGKTYRTVQEIRALCEQGNTRVLLLVPEQQAYSAERDVLSSLPPQAARHLSILSFTRLCDQLTDRFGGRSHTTLTGATRALLMWYNLRRLSGLFQTYGTSAAADPALCQRMLDTARELSANGITPEQLEEVSVGLPEDSPLAHKLNDIALITSAFDALVCDVCGNNPDHRLMRAAEQSDVHGFFEDTVVFIDSFTSFTVQEYALLRVIFDQAREVTVTMCTDGRGGYEAQFESMHDTLRRLTDLADTLGRDHEDILLTEIHRTASPELREIERGLWKFDLTPDQRVIPTPEERGSVELITAANVYEEALAAALHVLELAQSGIPYGEIAVVVRDTSTYQGILDAALEQYGIPYFLSERTDLNTKPAARLLLCALRCISRRFQTHDVLSLCKTGLGGVSPRDLDYFEEYTETWRISGRRMTEGAWSMNPDGYTVEWSTRGHTILEAANRVREQVIPPLMTLEVKLRAAETVSDQCRALFQYLCDLHVREQLSRKAEKHLSLGQVREAGEAVRLWDFLTEVLASVATVLPEDCHPLTADELSGALSVIFAESDIGSVPARHDCVTVGSAATLRVDNISASLLLGLNEGEFPLTVSDSGLLTEQDKSVLADHGLSLDSRADRLSSEELLYVWRAMTKPAHKLILSYATATPDGSKKAPSAAVSRVRYLLPYLEPVPFTSNGLEDTAATRYAVPMEDMISSPRIHALLGDQIWMSQSSLRRYAHCPYSYFGNKILKLWEPVSATIQTSTSGTFVHHVLEHYLRATLDEHHHLRPLSDEASVALADSIMLDYIKELCGDVTGNGRLLHLFDRLRVIALTLIDTIRAELTQSQFLPIALEWATYGNTPADPAPLILPLASPEENATHGPLPVEACEGPLPIPTAEDMGVSIHMGGRIDRVDTYRSEDGKRVYVRVVDYKNSRHDFDQRKVIEELDIQMLLYLFTLCSPANRRLFADENGNLPEEVLPAQVLYLSPIEDTKSGGVTPYRSGLIRNEDELLRAISADLDRTYLPGAFDRSGNLGGSGLCEPDRMRSLEQEMYDIIRATTLDLYHGCAHRTPSTQGCNYCSLRDYCAVAAEKPHH